MLRSAAIVLGFASLASRASCSDEPPPIVRPPRSAGSATSSASAVTPPRPPPFSLSQVLATAHPVGGPFRSHHGPGELDATVLSSDPDASYPPATGHDPKAGAVFLERLAGASGEASLYYAMQRRESPDETGGFWDFVVLTPNGALDPGTTVLCARCHADAPRGGVFGPPRPLK